MTHLSPEALAGLVKKVRFARTVPRSDVVAAILALEAERNAAVKAVREMVTANVENMRLAASAEAVLREIADRTVKIMNAGNRNSGIEHILTLARSLTAPVEKEKE